MPEITTSEIQVFNNNFPIDAYLAIPSTDEPTMGIVVVQEIFGVNSHIQDVTRRLALKGYVAIAPALYQRIEPGFQTGYTAEDVKIGRQYKDQTTAKELLGDIQAAIDKLESLPQVKSIGCIGFCFGGHVAYLAASLPAIQATASFYGAGIATSRPGGGEPTIKVTPEIKGKVYAFFGLEDTSIPAEQVEAIEKALTEQKSANRVFRYAGAEHGFFCDQRASYNKVAADDAWSKVLSLFKMSNL